MTFFGEGPVFEMLSGGTAALHIVVGQGRIHHHILEPLRDQERHVDHLVGVIFLELLTECAARDVRNYRLSAELLAEFGQGRCFLAKAEQ